MQHISYNNDTVAVYMPTDRLNDIGSYLMDKQVIFVTVLTEYNRTNSSM